MPRRSAVHIQIRSGRDRQSVKIASGATHLGPSSVRTSNPDSGAVTIAASMAATLHRARVADEARAHREEFDALADEWHAGTDHLSIASHKVNHPAYRDIIGMGRFAVPLILERVRRDRGDWFAALRHIARGDAAPNATSIDEAIEAWDQWARQKGYV